ncbi:hypothetical protein CRV08_03045 [Halarcobacter ebronensis]|uniref:Uncharacterized protein n=1 Tax=Halarcobacter ebronensis TaxID=1462615 RepID=A0A4Q0YGC1_9BACT|nr:hypothetical protein [Halarcobacter ebronensis]RXJ69696.1 hypothetical protein CRV08_03045 [Halarcobacter ebronensis]
MEYFPLIISFIAVIIALWQGYLAKSQLEQAKITKRDTEKLLDDIKEKVNKIEMISDETRKDVKEQISKLVDKQDENFKLLLNTPKENNQNEMIMKLFPSLMNNPELLKMFIEMGKEK